MKRRARNRKVEFISVLLYPAFCFGLLSCFDLRMPERMQRRDGGADAEAEALGDCSGMGCYEPPVTECSSGTGITLYSPVGYCELGECQYSSRSEECETGKCANGVCVDNPCQGVTCSQPPKPECSGNGKLKVYSDQGYCRVNDGAPECRYASSELDCEKGCEEGVCQGNPCTGVTCDRPPARHCKDDELVVYNTIGVCSQGECSYKKQYVECAKGCSEGICIGTQPCEWITCDIPPANHCVDNKLRVFESQGVCDEKGTCIYSHRDIECEQGCEQGQCKGDPCAGIVCERPPANSCESDDLITWNPIGFCTNGMCKYNRTVVTCAQGCENGSCMGEDPCAHVICNQKPPSYCVGDSLRVYQSKGTCNADGECVYDYQDTVCSQGCEAGQCKGDPCLGVSCDNPPAAKCVDANTREVWDGFEGVCEAGSCSYGTELVTCQSGCRDGQCTGDPCAGVTCGNPGPCETTAGATCIDGNCAYPVDTGAGCNDGDDCTYSDMCQTDKSCRGTSYTCDDPGSCETETGASCNGDGSCDYPADTSAECSDGNSCTTDDQCQSDKSCRGTAITECQNGDGCCPSGCNSGNDGDCIEPIDMGRIAAGDTHTCALLNTGNLRCWGLPGWGGQLGYGNKDVIGDDETPADAGDVNVGGLVVQVATGAEHTCALLNTGNLRCWGRGTYGALGYNNTLSIGDDETPADVGDINVGETVVQVATGGKHTCALLETGNVRCWGYNDYGQLGYGDTTTRRSPVDDVEIGGTVVQIAAGGWHTCALLDTGNVRCWGQGFSGQIGYANQTDIGDDEIPADAGDVEVGGTAVQISAGLNHNCVLLDTGNIRCWGSNDWGQLGYANTRWIGDNETPASAGDIDIGGTVVQVAAGGNHNCALLETGKVRCWGRSQYGQLGYGNVAECDLLCSSGTQCCIGDNETPASAGDVEVGGFVVQVATGYNHTCALLDSGDLYCWGWGAHAKLGYGNTAECTNSTSNCSEAAQCCIGDDETPASAGDVPYR